METFIQPKITGYRQLNEEEAALMNEGKRIGQELSEYTSRLRARAYCMPSVPAQDAIKQAEALRWLEAGELQAQQALMCLIRSIALPTTF